MQYLLVPLKILKGKIVDKPKKQGIYYGLQYPDFAINKYFNHKALYGSVYVTSREIFAGKNATPSESECPSV
jgi:hypothetical protein